MYGSIPVINVTNEPILHTATTASARFPGNTVHKLGNCLLTSEQGITAIYGYSVIIGTVARAGYLTDALLLAESRDTFASVRFSPS
jgi:hypothetical protein